MSIRREASVELALMLVLTRCQAPPPPPPPLLLSCPGRLQKLSLHGDSKRARSRSLECCSLSSVRATWCGKQLYRRDSAEARDLTASSTCVHRCFIGCANWSKYVQTCANLCKQVHICSNMFKYAWSGQPGDSISGGVLAPRSRVASIRSVQSAFLSLQFSSTMYNYITM